MSLVLGALSIKRLIYLVIANEYVSPTAKDGDDMKRSWSMSSLAVLLLAVSGAVAAALPKHTSLTIDEPSDLSPMTVAAVLTQGSSKPGGTLAVLFGVRLLAGWHTYAFVPPEEPYVQTEWSIDPGPGLSAPGDWIAPPSVPDSQNPRMTLYESSPAPLIFVHALKVAADASGTITVRTGIVYQVCNIQRCLPPTQKTFDLPLKVAEPSP